MSEVKQNFDGMRAGIAAIDNAWQAIEVQINSSLQTSEDLLQGWKGDAADVWREIKDDWEREIKKANERLKDLEQTLKDILNDAVEKENSRKEKVAQVKFNKQF
ncbi:WXG100 family type VII secretion target [Streptomyces sp. NPDC005125]